MEARGGGKRRIPGPRPGAVPEARGGGWEEQPHTQGVVAARAQEGQRSHPMLKVRKGSRRRYPLSKVRSRGCALLEQPSRDTPCPK